MVGLMLISEKIPEEEGLITHDRLSSLSYSLTNNLSDTGGRTHLLLPFFSFFDENISKCYVKDKNHYYLTRGGAGWNSPLCQLVSNLTCLGEYNPLLHFFRGLGL